MSAPSVPPHELKKAYLALLVVYLVWGTTFGAIHIGVETIPPVLLACLRFLTAGFLVITFCLMRGEAFPDKAALKTHFWVGLLLFVGGNTVVCWAVKHITTGLGATLTATNPFWLLGLAALIPPREAVPSTAFGGLLIGFLGLLVLLSPQLAHPQTLSAEFWWSVAAVLAMGVCWCMGSIVNRKFPPKTSLLMGVGIQNAFAGLVLLPVTLALGEWHPIAPSVSSWLALAYLIGIGTMLAISCYYYALKRLSIPLLGTIAYVTPVITYLFGWLFLHEPITQTTILGTGIILAGVGLVQRASAASPQPKPVTATPHPLPLQTAGSPPAQARCVQP